MEYCFQDSNGNIIGCFNATNRGDGLGNHTASENINVSGWDITEVDTLFTNSGVDMILDPGRNLIIKATELHHESSNPSYLLDGDHPGTVGSVIFRRETGARYAIIRSDGTKKQFIIGTDSAIGHAVLIVSEDVFDNDFDHPIYIDPHLCVQSATNPDTDNTQYICTSHNRTDGIINTATGRIIFKNNTVAEKNFTAVDITAINYYGNGNTLDNVVTNPFKEDVNASIYAITDSINQSRIYFENNVFVVEG